MAVANRELMKMTGEVNGIRFTAYYGAYLETLDIDGLLFSFSLKRIAEYAKDGITTAGQLVEHLVKVHSIKF